MCTKYETTNELRSSRTKKMSSNHKNWPPRMNVLSQYLSLTSFHSICHERPFTVFVMNVLSQYLSWTSFHSICHERPFTVFVMNVLSQYLSNQLKLSAWLICFAFSFYRILYWNGVVTTEFIINTQKQMQIHTMLREVSSLLIWGGYLSQNIQMLLGKAKW